MAGQKIDGGPRVNTLRAHRPKPADVGVSYQKYHADVLDQSQNSLRPITEDLPGIPANSWFSRHSRSIGIGMILMCLMVWSGVTYVVPFVSDKVNHWNHGEAKLSYYHLNVGHNGASDFLAEYIHGQAVVIEMPGGKVEKMTGYSIPIASANDNTPRIVTLVVQSINPSGKAGKPDLLVEVEGFPAAIPLYNTGEAFQTQEHS